MQDWESFGRRVFRYIELTFRHLYTPVRLECVSARRIGYPVQPISSFECSDETVNRAWKTDIEFLAVGMQDDYEACPPQETGADLSEARIMALKNYYSVRGSAAGGEDPAAVRAPSAGPEAPSGGSSGLGNDAARLLPLHGRLGTAAGALGKPVRACRGTWIRPQRRCIPVPGSARRLQAGEFRRQAG